MENKEEIIDAKGKNKAYFKGDNDILTEAKVVR